MLQEIYVSLINSFSKKKKLKAVQAFELKIYEKQYQFTSSFCFSNSII